MISGLSNITKRPIVIIASPRTGSTALAHHIANLYPSVPLYSEPNFVLAEMEKFVAYASDKTTNKNQYILKLLGSSLNLYPSDIIANIFSENTFRIKITRKNIIEQLASHYVAEFRGVWDYTAVDDKECQEYTDNIIKINLDRIQRSIKLVGYDNFIVSQISADLELYYEDFDSFMSPTKKTPLPLNYAELVDAIKELYSAGVS